MSLVASGSGCKLIRRATFRFRVVTPFLNVYRRRKMKRTFEDGDDDALFMYVV